MPLRRDIFIQDSEPIRCYFSHIIDISHFPTTFVMYCGSPEMYLPSQGRSLPQ